MPDGAGELEKVYPGIRALAVRLSDVRLAEDLVQDAFLKAPPLLARRYCDPSE